MSDRLNRKDLKHDKFVEDVGSAYTFARANRSQLLGALLGVLALALLTAGFIAYRARQENRAQSRLAEGIELMNAPVTETRSPEMKGPVFKTEDEKIAKSEPVFNDVVTKFRGSDAASIADLYLARIAASRGDVASARPRLERFVEDHGDNLLAGPARQSLYELRIQAGEGQKVAGELEAELKKDKPVIPADSILSLLSRAYQNLGNSAKATEMNRRIITEYPDSPYFLDAQRKLPPA